MNYAIRLEQYVGRSLAVVRRRAALHELPRVVPEACGVLWKALRPLYPSGLGRNVAVYWDDQINLDVGVELDAPFAGFGEVIGSTPPTGLAAVTTHFGPYGQLGDAHDAIHRWCKANGHTPVRPCWEVYGHWQEEWNADPSKITTDVCYLLRS